jgi:hypothetical protein
MGDDRRRVIYDGFDSVTHRHSDAWVRVADEFVALAFAGDACFVKCLCRECRNLIRLKKSGGLVSCFQTWLYAKLSGMA